MSQRISSRLTDWGQNDQLNLNLQFDKTKVNQMNKRTNTWSQFLRQVQLQLPTYSKYCNSN